MSHDWSEPDAQRVRTCRREGCGVQQKPSIGMLRSFGWRRRSEDRWQVGMIQCSGKKDETKG